MKNLREYLKLRVSETRNVVKSAAKSALFITKLAVIISKSFHHFAKVLSLLGDARSLGGARSLDGAG